MTTAPANTASFDTMRHAMVVSQLRTSAVDDARVVEAMAAVPREAFVPESVRHIAYIDRQLPVGGGRFVNTPLATGRLITAVDLSANDNVLIVGAGAGYAAAVVARIAGRVTAVEQDADLAAAARGALAGTPNVTLVEGPLADGASANAPYDVVIIDGAVESVPDAIVAQLRVDGRIATGLVDRGVTRLASGRRTEGGFGLADFADLDCAILPGFSKPTKFRF